jgi:hypothetical protein
VTTVDQITWDPGQEFTDAVAVVDRVLAQHASPTPGQYAAEAAELHRIADDLAAVVEAGLSEQLWVQLSIQPRSGLLPKDEGTEDQSIRTVDAVAQALFGRPGRAHHMTSSGTWHHDAHGRRGDVNVAVLCGITPPDTREKDVELDRLRAELAEANHKLAGATAAAALTPDALPGEAPQ